MTAAGREQRYRRIRQQAANYGHSPRLNTCPEAPFSLKAQAVKDGFFVNIILSGIAKTRNALLLGKRP